MTQLNIQPFQVRALAPLSVLQMEWLSQLYQPLCGSDGIGLYITFSQLSDGGTKFGTPRIHDGLFNRLKMTAEQFQEARHHLEALGLLRTYQSHDKTQAPTILYELLSPLDLDDFIKHRELQTVLKQTIGDQAFYQLLKQYEVSTVDVSQFTEVTLSFATKFGHLFNEEAPLLELGDIQHQRAYQPIEVKQEDDILRWLLPMLVTEKIPVVYLTRTLQQLLEEFSELCHAQSHQVVSLIKLAITSTGDGIDYGWLTQNLHKLQKTTKLAMPQSLKGEVVPSTKTGTTPFDYQELIKAAEALPNDVFLARLKEEKKGFVTAQEQQNLKKLQEKSQLSAPVLNMLLYFILKILNKDNLWQRELERYANEWQQANIRTADQVVGWLKARKQRQKSDNDAQSKGKPAKNYKSPSVRAQEPIPKWRQEQSSATQEEVNLQEAEAVKARLNQLMGRGDQS